MGVATGLGVADAEQLPGVVPLVQRLGGIDALEALQPDQRGVEHLGEGLRGLGLADTGLPLEQQGLRESHRAEQGGRKSRIGEVADRGEALGQRADVGDEVGDVHEPAGCSRGYFPGSAT